MVKPRVRKKIRTQLKNDDDANNSSSFDVILNIPFSSILIYYNLN